MRLAVFTLALLIHTVLVAAAFPGRDFFSSGRSAEPTHNRDLVAPGRQWYPAVGAFNMTCVFSLFIACRSLRLSNIYMVPTAN